VPLVLLVHPDPPWSTFSVKFQKVWIRINRSGPHGPQGPQPPLVDQERSGPPWTTLRHFPDASVTKSVFHVEFAEFLGYIVGIDRVIMSERMVESGMNWRAPRSVKEVQIFINFPNFYRQFIKDFSKICTPITETLKGYKAKFHGHPKQDKAFTELKKRFVSAPILEHFYPNRETVVETDATDFALGCLLSQFKDKRLHPVAFHSRKVNPMERNYEIHNKELLAILEAFKKWNHYLVGADKPVRVYTDHQNLQNFLKTRFWNQRQIRWAQRLADYHFEIVYRPGKRGGKLDSLSRWPEYRPEEGAKLSEQSILKSEHFQISLIHEDDKDEGYISEPELAIRNRVRVKRLSNKAILPTKGSRLAAGHDIYTISEFTIPVQGQVLAETGIAIGLPKGTYARIAPQSGRVGVDRTSGQWFWEHGHVPKTYNICNRRPVYNMLSASRL